MAQYEDRQQDVPSRPIFVVQEHRATRLHYDFRLETAGVLKSWAVPKEPPRQPGQKRLAVQVEDHALAYATFTGTIPAGQYGAGTVARWDEGTYDNLLADRPVPQTVAEGIAAGRLELALHGQKLQGKFALVRMRDKSHRQAQWLLMKVSGTATRPVVPADEPARQPAPTHTNPSRSHRPSGTHRRSSVATRRSAAAQAKSVTYTHTERLMYPESGITKGDVLHFYQRIAKWLLPYLQDRPATIERLPAGIEGADAAHFWQKRTPEYYPQWIKRVDLPSGRGEVPYVLVNDHATLLYLVNQGALTFHVGFSRLASLERPDVVLFDLDPGPAGFAAAVTVARKLRSLLLAANHTPYVKTTGKTGLHVLVPWRRQTEYAEARSWAFDVAQQVVAALPEQATTERRKAERGQRVYIDVMQNASGHHAVPPYVLRAVPGAPVSTPLHWQELSRVRDAKTYTLKTIFRRLARQQHDPMAALLGVLRERVR